ncbi:MAG: glycine cleavage system protein GcvH [Magnetococcales bacterium]|nr:glycine cleavage system protein GcvH [Magnetococcales bacterium]
MSNTPPEIPSSCKYTKEHEWARMHGSEVEVGITAFAAQQLGDVVFVELPAVGRALTAGQPFGVVESVKSVSDLFAPLSGRVTAVNTELESAPERLNEAPYAQGWILRMQPDDLQAFQNLLSAEEYATWINP